MFGGFGADTDADSAMNSLACSIWSAGLKRRSKPIVDDAFELIALPQSEPATWPGKTSTPSGSSSSRCRERKRPSAPSFGPTARSGRAASPTKSESPVRTSQVPRRASGRSRARTCAPAGGRAAIARRTTSPSSSSAPSASGVVLVLRLGRRVDRDRDAVLEREPAVAGEVVGVRVRLDRPHDLDPRRAASREERLDRVGRVDDRGDTCFLVADQVRRTAEVVVHELLEQHEP